MKIRDLQLDMPLMLGICKEDGMVELERCEGDLYIEGEDAVEGVFPHHSRQLLLSTTAQQQ